MLKLSGLLARNVSRSGLARELSRTSIVRPLSVAVSQRVAISDSAKTSQQQSSWMAAAAAGLGLGLLAVDQERRSQCCGIVGVVGTPEHGDARYV